MWESFFVGPGSPAEGSFSGNNYLVDIEHQIQQVFNVEGKVVPFLVDYDQPNFMRNSASQPDVINSNTTQGLEGAQDFPFSLKEILCSNINHRKDTKG